MSFIIFFDLETGGVEDRHPNIQLAAVAIDEQTWREVASLEVKIRFSESDADPEALRLNHYDREAWEREAVLPAEAVRRFCVFIDPYRSIKMISKSGKAYSVAKIAGHNSASFDFPRLRRMFGERFMPCAFFVRDTLHRALWWLDEHPEAPRPKNLKLATLAEYFAVSVEGADAQAHDALTDARMAAALARRMMEAR